MESFIDSVLAIQEHIDPSLIQPRKLGKTHLLEAKMKELKDAPPGGSKSSNPYDELWNLDKSTTGPQEALSGNRAFPLSQKKI